jgi:hypothetical protein
MNCAGKVKQQNATQNMPIAAASRLIIAIQSCGTLRDSDL